MQRHIFLTSMRTTQVMLTAVVATFDVLMRQYVYDAWNILFTHVYLAHYLGLFWLRWIFFSTLICYLYVQYIYIYIYIYICNKYRSWGSPDNGVLSKFTHQMESSFATSRRDFLNGVYCRQTPHGACSVDQYRVFPDNLACIARQYTSQECKYVSCKIKEKGLMAE